MDKEHEIYGIQWNATQPLKKNIAISNNMNGYYCYYAKQNKSNKYHISSVICGIIKKKKKKALGYRKQEWWLPEATRVECGENWVKGVKKVKV